MAIVATKKTNNYLIIFGLLFAYFFPRLIIIWKFPPFNDESIYLRWGQIMMNPAQTFYSFVIDGKPPLLFWIYGWLMQFISDPFWAGRLCSLSIGLGTLVFLYKLTKKIYDIKTARLASLIYALLPLTIFFDSLALADGILSFIFAGILLSADSLENNFNYRFYLILGLLIGIGLWFKTTALLFLLMFLGWQLYLFSQKKVFRKKIICGSLTTVVVIFFVYLPLILHPVFLRSVIKQNTYALSISEILVFPWKIWMFNLRDIILVYVGMVSPIFFLAFLLKNKINKFLLFYFIFSISLLTVSARTLHCRYVLFSVIPFIPLFAKSLTSKKIFIGIFLTIILILNFILLKNPVNYFHLFPKIGTYAVDSWQYVDGWPSGYGVKEAIDYVNSDRNKQPALIGVRWDSGNPEDTVLLSSAKYDNLQAAFLDKRLSDFEEVALLSRKIPMYFIARKGQYGGLENNLELLKIFSKPDGLEAVEVFKFKY